MTKNLYKVLRGLYEPHSQVLTLSSRDLHQNFALVHVRNARTKNLKVFALSGTTRRPTPMPQLWQLQNCRDLTVLSIFATASSRARLLTCPSKSLEDGAEPFGRV